MNDFHAEQGSRDQIHMCHSGTCGKAFGKHQKLCYLLFSHKANWAAPGLLPITSGSLQQASLTAELCSDQQYQVRKLILRVSGSEWDPGLYLTSRRVYMQRKLKSHRLTLGFLMGQEEMPGKTLFAMQINALIVKSTKRQRAEKPHEKFIAVDPMGWSADLTHRRLSGGWQKRYWEKKYQRAKREQTKLVITFCEQIWWDIVISSHWRMMKKCIKFTAKKIVTRSSSTDKGQHSQNKISTRFNIFPFFSAIDKQCRAAPVVLATPAFGERTQL